MDYIFDINGIWWKVIDDSNLHNVYCIYGEKGTALFCVDPKCEDNDLKDIIIF